MIKAEVIHKRFIERILNEGTFDENPRPRYKSDGTPAYSKFITQAFEEYDISKGELPITELRPVSLKGGVNELLAIYQTQTNTREGFESHSVRWWEDWMNEEGNIGRAYPYNLESHRPNEMKREVVKVRRRIIDKEFGEQKEIPLANKIKESIDGNVYFDRYIVIGESDKRDDKNRKHYYIQFIKTGYITEIRKDQIGKSKSFDQYKRTTYGVGYLGDYQSVKNFTNEQVAILKDKWENMFRRCYSDKYEHRDLYKNIFVHQEWHSFEQFLRDVRYLPQYHLAKEVDFKDWDLDKDYYGSNCYSRETCVFLSNKENKLYSKSKPFKYKGKVYISQHDLANEYNVGQPSISVALKNGLYKKEPIKFIDEDYEILYRYELSRNQVNELLKNLKNDAFGRRHMLSFFHWANQDKKQLVECAFMTLWSVRKVKDEYYIDCTLVQRSSDYLVAGHINMIQYVALMMMVAHECGYKVGKFARFTQNLHIYSRHEEQAHELLKREPNNPEKPELILNAEGKGFYDITADDFELVNYNPIRPQLRFDLGV